jgi:putative membrane protein
LEQFTSSGIGQRKDRSGILIFVSLAERYARIIADDEIATRVAQSEWQAAVNALVDHMRDGRIADGFVTQRSTCVEMSLQSTSHALRRATMPSRTEFT